jgi:hypothetical protein
LLLLGRLRTSGRQFDTLPPEELIERNLDHLSFPKRLLQTVSSADITHLGIDLQGFPTAGRRYEFAVNVTACNVLVQLITPHPLDVAIAARYGELLVLAWHPASLRKRFRLQLYKVLSDRFGSLSPSLILKLELGNSKY